MAINPDISRRTSETRALMPGVMAAVVVALASPFISDHYGAPAAASSVAETVFRAALVALALTTLPIVPS